MVARKIQRTRCRIICRATEGPFAHSFHANCISAAFAKRITTGTLSCAVQRLGPSNQLTKTLCTIFSRQMTIIIPIFIHLAMFLIITTTFFSHVAVIPTPRVCATDGLSTTFAVVLAFGPSCGTRSIAALWEIIHIHPYSIASETTVPADAAPFFTLWRHAFFVVLGTARTWWTDVSDHHMQPSELSYNKRTSTYQQNSSSTAGL